MRLQHFKKFDFAAMQEALVDAAGSIGTTGKTGVFVGCMWSHEFLEILPHLVCFFST